MDAPIKKPMLAASIDADAGQSIDTLRYPVYATVKVDGLRCLVMGGVATSRSLKPIPSAHVQAYFAAHPELEHLDGELVVMVDGKVGNFQQCSSGLMSEDKVPDFRFYAFDCFTNPAMSYESRIRDLRTKLARCPDRVVPLYPVECHTPAELRAFLETSLAEGWEGVMVRSADGPYKQGRATFKEGYLTKVKIFEDAEATVVGFEERMHNANEAKTNALGRTERSSHKDGLVPMGTLGALVCSSPKWAGTFNLGTGFTDALRAEIWANRDSWKGATVRFRYQAIGTKDLPRIPVFQGRRDEKDL